MRIGDTEREATTRVCSPAPVSGSDRATRDRVDRLERLLAVGRVVATEPDLPTVLGQIVETARELTGAQYAALGVLDKRRDGSGAVPDRRR